MDLTQCWGCRDDPLDASVDAGPVVIMADVPAQTEYLHSNSIFDPGYAELRGDVPEQHDVPMPSLNPETGEIQLCILRTTVDTFSGATTLDFYIDQMNLS